MVEPVSPNDIVALKEKAIPDLIIEAVNTLIVDRWNGRSATVKQKEVVSAVAYKIDRRAIYENHWLDFEDVFRAKGWTVEFDKPGYNESYDAYWVFTK